MTGEDDSSSPPPAPSVNAPLVLRNLANQALIGSTIWSGGSGYEVLVATAHLDPLSVLLGVGGAIPLLALSRTIETLELPLVSGLNLSTNMAVMNLFGPRAKPLQAGALSLVLAAGTGIVEETVFRGQREFSHSVSTRIRAPTLALALERVSQLALAIARSFVQLCSPTSAGLRVTNTSFHATGWTARDISRTLR